MESIRQNIVWRINASHHMPVKSQLEIIHCLPSSVSDPFGRPIIVLKVSALVAEYTADTFKLLLLSTIDRLQAHLKKLNTSRDRKGRPIFQYIVMLDLADVSIQHVVC
jgi:retinaldehyde-binding protein 1